MTTIDRLPGEVTVPWCRSARVVWRRTLAGVVVLPLAEPNTEPLELRGAAAGIWELLGEPLTASELVTALAATYGVHEEQVADDVTRALDLLLELGALCRG